MDPSKPSSWALFQGGEKEGGGAGKAPAPVPAPAASAAAASAAAAAAVPAASAEEQQLELPAGWKQKVDPKSGRTYYTNKRTKESRWRHPALPNAGSKQGGGAGQQGRGGKAKAKVKEKEKEKEKKKEKEAAQHDGLVVGAAVEAAERALAWAEGLDQKRTRAVVARAPLAYLDAEAAEAEARYAARSSSRDLLMSAFSFFYSTRTVSSTRPTLTSLLVTYPPGTACSSGCWAR